MKTVTENAEYCELFFELINEMICKFNNNKESSKFNPVHRKYDEHPGNQIAIKNVFGIKFYQERTSSCEYHFNKSVNEDISTYKKLWADMKNSVTTESYEICKQRMIKLIGVQEISARKPLFDTLEFWDSIKSRWATSYWVGLHNIPKSSLAEAAQASMKAASEKNISLVDATYADIIDSARLDAKWINRIEEEESRGWSPSQVELDERYEARQINRAKRYIEETSDFNHDLTPSAEHTINTTTPVLARQSNNAPPKVKRKRLISTETRYFRKLLRKSLLMEGQTRVLSLTQGSEKTHLMIQCQNTNYNVEIAKAVRCDCFSQQMAGKKTSSGV